MKKTIYLFILGIIILNTSLAYAVPPPCNEETLLNSSEFAIEGYVMNIECGNSFDSGVYKSDKEDFKPELVAKCVADIVVTKNLKGEYNHGDTVKISFTKLIRRPEADGTQIFKIPGAPKKDFKLKTKIRYYDSDTCPYSNSQELEADFNEIEKILQTEKLLPEKKGNNYLYYTIPLGAIAFLIIIYRLLKIKK